MPELEGRPDDPDARLTDILQRAHEDHGRALGERGTTVEQQAARAAMELSGATAALTAAVDRFAEAKRAASAILNEYPLTLQADDVGATAPVRALSEVMSYAEGAAGTAIDDLDER